MDIYDYTLKHEDFNGMESIITVHSAPNITWQHIWSFSETRDALHESVFTKIPNEIMLRIFNLLSVRDLCNISLVCRWFKMIADQDEIWKLKCNSTYTYYFFSYYILTAQVEKSYCKIL